MRKAGRIFSLLVLVLVIALSTGMCFASENFHLVEAYPNDGATGTAIENVSFKLYFDTEFTEDVLKTKNQKAFTLTGPENETLPIKVLYMPKEKITEEGVKGIILVLLDNTGENDNVKIEGNQEYTLKISADLTDDAGNVFGKEESITIKTMNQTMNMLVNMLLMAVMFGVMFFFTMKSAQKSAEETQKAKDDKVNPYKEAKKTGKSVEEIVEKDKKDKAKRAKKEAKKAQETAALLEEFGYTEDDTDNYRVRGPRPIASAGGTYKTGRKAIADGKKAEKEKNSKKKK